MEDLESSNPYSVVVVGGGISGLTAAYTISKRDPSLKCVVLEAKDRVGGRTQSVPLKTESGEDTFDVGGQWVGTSQVDVMDMLRELDLETYKQYSTGRKFMQLGSHKISSYTSVIPSLSIFALLDLNSFMKKVEKLVKSVDIHEPYKNSPQAEKWDAMTVAEFCNQNLWTRGAKDTMISALRCMFGVECSQISVLYFLLYAKAAGSLQNLIEPTENCGQGLKIKGGAEQISNRLAAKLGKDTVKLNHPVKSIEQKEDYVLVKTVDGKEFKCCSVIIATPPNMTYKIHFEPSLPCDKREVMKRMPAGFLVKILITYSSAFWREAGQSGEIVTNGGPTEVEGCDEGPLCIVYDACSSKHSPALVTFIGGRQADQWLQQSASERQSAVLKSLSTFFGEEVWNYKDYREKDWSLEPYNEGGPVCTVSPGAMPYFASGLRKPFDRIHFAGTESATRWCGFMNGAIQAGKRAALEVIHQLHPHLISYEEMQEKVVISDTFNTKPKSSRSYVKISVGCGTVIAVGLLVVYYYRRK